MYLLDRICIITGNGREYSENKLSFPNAILKVTALTEPKDLDSDFELDLYRGCFDEIRIFQEKQRTLQSQAGQSREMGGIGWRYVFRLKHG